MVGPTHTSNYHDKLYYTNQFPQTLNDSYENFLQKYNEGQRYGDDLLIIDKRPITINKITPLRGGGY